MLASDLPDSSVTPMRDVMEIAHEMKTTKKSYKLEVMKARLAALTLARCIIEEANAKKREVSGHVLDAMAEVFRESRDLNSTPKQNKGFALKRGYGTRHSKMDVAEAMKELDGE